MVEIFVMSVISEGGQLSMGQATLMMDTSYIAVVLLSKAMYFLIVQSCTITYYIYYSSLSHMAGWPCFVNE